MLRRVIQDFSEIPAALRRGEIGKAESILYRNRGSVPELVETAYRIVVSHAACNMDRLDNLFQLADRQMEYADTGRITAFYQLLLSYFTEAEDMDSVLWLMEKNVRRASACSDNSSFQSVLCDCITVDSQKTASGKHISIFQAPSPDQPTMRIAPEICNTESASESELSKTA